MTTLQQLAPSPQASSEVPINENFATLSATAIFGKRQPATTGLTWAYYGGLYSSTSIANGTVTLTGSATNYVVVHRSDGVVSVSTATTNWTNTTDYGRLYKLTTSASVVTAEEDHRFGDFGIIGKSSTSGDIGASIHGAASKTTPVDADEFAIADSAASYVLKKLTWANLKAGVWSAWGALIAAGTSKSTPVDADKFALSDSAASNATKYLSWANLKATLKTYTDTLYAAIGAVTGSGLTMATGKLLGRSTASTGAIEEITVGSGLSLSAGTLSSTGSGGTVTTTGSPASGNLTKFSGASSVTNGDLSGDVTTSGTLAATIANDAVSNAKLANMATATIKGRTTAGTGDPEDLTATQATALLNAVVGDSGSGGTKGLVPAPGAGDAAAGKFLKADGTFAVPPGSGVSLSTVNVFTKNQSVSPYALTDGATISVDASQSNNFTVTLGGNRTLANPTNLTNGMVLNFCVTQDGTGSRTLSFGSKYKWGLGGADASPSLSATAGAVDFLSCYYDSASDTLRCALIGRAGPKGANGTNGANGAGSTWTVSGRLTLESGVPFSTTDQTSKTTIYWTPYLGNEVILWNGSAWTSYSSSEISIALGTLTSGKNYDVFMYQSSGTPTLELGSAWTNDTTRATDVTLQDGRYCKSGDKTRLYLGTFRTTSTTTTEDSAGGTSSQTGGKRFLWNHYNQIDKHAAVIDTTNSWSYATDTIRQANGASGNKVEFVVGLATLVSVDLRCNYLGQNNTARGAKVGVGIDSTTAFSGLTQQAYNGTGTAMVFAVGAAYKGHLAAGYHYAAWCERGADNTSTFYGDDGGGVQSGLIAELRG